MAAGSRTKYALDLNDIFAFPDGNNIPLRPPNIAGGESWVMLLEIMGIFPSTQLTYTTIDVTGKCFNVVINTSNPPLDTVGYERGHTLCIRNAEPLFGRNDQFYYRVDDISTVEFSCFPSRWLRSGSSAAASQNIATAEIWGNVSLVGVLAEEVVDIAEVGIVPRSVNVLIGLNINLNVKLWALYIGIIERTGVSGDVDVLRTACMSVG